MNIDQSKSLENWIPVKFIQDPELLYQWQYFGDKMFTEPFFDETINASKSNVINSKLIRSYSNTDILTDWIKDFEVIQPTAFIFHISRCGSTLFSQMFAELQKNIVLSEVPIFDDVVRYGRKNNISEITLNNLKVLIQFYGIKRAAPQTNLIIKTDSWHIHFYEELRELFPDTPFFLLYRNPLDVLRSQKKMRGIQSVPGLLEKEIFGFGEEINSITNLDEYMSMVIESYLVQFIEITRKDPLSFALNYLDGPTVNLDLILHNAKIQLTNDEREKMIARAKFNAKEPLEIFSEPENVDQIPAYLKMSVSLYNNLEMIRTSKIY